MRCVANIGENCDRLLMVWITYTSSFLGGLHNLNKPNNKKNFSKKRRKV